MNDDNAMNAERERRERDLLRLNALVDGELDPAAQAEIAARLAADRDLARGYAALARLKACVMEFVETAPVMQVPSQPASSPARAVWRRFAWPAAAAAIVAILSGAGFLAFMPRSEPVALEDSADRPIMFAAFPMRPVIPDFAAARLSLRGVDFRTLADGPLLVATYRGPRGCRLELHVRPAGLAAPAPGGSRRAGWNAGQLAYELIAFGMPEARFAIIAEAARRQTRLNADPDAASGLRQAGLAAPPCTG